MPIEINTKESFVSRHIGPSDADIEKMLAVVGSNSLEHFIDSVIPQKLRTQNPPELEAPLSEVETAAQLRRLASRNQAYRSLIGLGYFDTVTPPVVQRNILENPGWYTQYTPYQAEIAQGRLEALLNFQTVIIDLTGFPIANASLLDEATAAAEVMNMFFAAKNHPEKGVFFVSDGCLPQTISVLKTRAEWIGITIVVGDAASFKFSGDVFGCLLQYPAQDGAVHNYSDFCAHAHAAGARVAVAADPMSLLLLKAPAEFGADAAVGSTQRFGIPMGYGGPHAAYFATTEEFKRIMPGRIIGVSIDADGKRALRMALQTREQHIRRDKATSNICTAQVLLAVMAGMYAVYHGPDGMKRIAERIHNCAKVLAAGLNRLGWRIHHAEFFDTLRVSHTSIGSVKIRIEAEKHKFNFRYFDDGSIGISLDERTTAEEVETVLAIFAGSVEPQPVGELARALESGYTGAMKRTSAYLTHPVFHAHHSETEMLRYIRMLESRDLSLTSSMIALGSCTMKLNATTEMLGVTMGEFAQLHPFAPPEQAEGYRKLFRDLETWLARITGFFAVSLQPNSGAQGEFTGLMVIRAYQKSRGEQHRDVCLIPASAHGTNPASAVMAGMKVVVVRCDEQGNIDVDDLRRKAEENKQHLSSLMVTYPSTHGVFEESIKDLCSIVHANGGQVYMDGANLNAQVGLCKPVELGADVCHINLHKTFAIPHGGGGPGMGPIAVASHLAPFLPGHALVHVGGDRAIESVSAAPWGSASVLCISWSYIAMMGAEGLRKATAMAMLNANYMAKRLEKHFPVLYKGINGRVAHEFILDVRGLKTTAGVEAEDIAKRLMDYGFHAPTVSFPVAGTLMIEPTESEPLAELDRFCDALVMIKAEAEEIAQGTADKTNNVLKNAPHTAANVVADEWKHPYTRERAAFPAPWTRERKFWPAVSRVNNAYGDRTLVCACGPVEDYAAK